MPCALITGITGQDGSYLAELLLSRGYEVHGTLRPRTDPARSHLAPLLEDGATNRGALVLHRAELEDPTTLEAVLRAVAPEEVYHLAGPSHLGFSFEAPEATCVPIVQGVLRVLETARALPRPTRVFLPSSAAIFGQPAHTPQDEDTPLAPLSPYGCAMAFVTHLARAIRQTRGTFVVCGILYNHESPRRGESFVTRKITRAAAAIKLGLRDTLVLGNLDARRDWGHARDFVRAMWLALQAPTARDYVIATGRTHTVREVVELAFGHLGLDPWRHVRTDPALRRPADPTVWTGNADRARRELGWQPEVSFAELIREMVEADLAALRAESRAR